MHFPAEYGTIAKVINLTCFRIPEVFSCMTQSLPRSFRAVFVLVMLLLCLTMVTQILHQQSLRSQISLLTEEISITQQRLAKQQQEYDQALASLPQVQSELAQTQPAADEVYAKEQAMRAQRKALRAENAELAAQLEALVPELDAASAAVLNAQLAASYLEDAIESVQAAIALLD